MECGIQVLCSSHRRVCETTYSGLTIFKLDQYKFVHGDGWRDGPLFLRIVPVYLEARQSRCHSRRSCSTHLLWMFFFWSSSVCQESLESLGLQALHGSCAMSVEPGEPLGTEKVMDRRYCAYCRTCHLSTCIHLHHIHIHRYEIYVLSTSPFGFMTMYCDHMFVL